jgi:hypothetical protein
VFAVSRNTRYRGLILLLLAVLWFSVVRAGRFSPQQRYLVNVGPISALVAAIALTLVTARFPRLLRTSVLAAAAGVTLLGLLALPQGWNWGNQQALRSINTVLSLVTTENDPVFADPRTMLVLYEFNGFKPYPGGIYRFPAHLPEDSYWRVQEGAFTVGFGIPPDGLDLDRCQQGWVVVDRPRAEELERAWAMAIPKEVRVPPANWLPLVSYTRGTGLVTLYRILPRSEQPRR